MFVRRPEIQQPYYVRVGGEMSSSCVLATDGVWEFAHVAGSDAVSVPHVKHRARRASRIVAEHVSTVGRKLSPSSRSARRVPPSPARPGRRGRRLSVAAPSLPGGEAPRRARLKRAHGRGTRHTAPPARGPRETPRRPARIGFVRAARPGVKPVAWPESTQRAGERFRRAPGARAAPMA